LHAAPRSLHTSLFINSEKKFDLTGTGHTRIILTNISRLDEQKAAVLPVSDEAESGHAKMVHQVWGL
jgi:hypothetical protein